jgi:hypothetical protein
LYKAFEEFFAILMRGDDIPTPGGVTIKQTDKDYAVVDLRLDL